VGTATHGELMILISTWFLRRDRSIDRLTALVAKTRIVLPTRSLRTGCRASFTPGRLAIVFFAATKRQQFTHLMVASDGRKTRLGTKLARTGGYHFAETAA
jgi:hypothetical protein